MRAHRMAVGAAEGAVASAPLSDLSVDIDTGERTSTKVCRVCVARIVTRLVLLGLLVLLAQFVDVRGHVNRYCAWVQHIEAHSLKEATALYALGATAFTTLSPTGYLPTVLAGALFPWCLLRTIIYTAWLHTRSRPPSPACVLCVVCVCARARARVCV